MSRFGRAARMGLLFAVFSIFWIDGIHSDLEMAIESAPGATALWGAALAAFAARLATQAVETGAYVAGARLAGTRVRFGPLFFALFALSMLDALAAALVRWNAGGAPPMWLVALTGFRAIPDVLAAEPGLRIALGGIGALALLRVAGTGYALVQQGVRTRFAVLLVGAGWIAGRLATWWTTDLARGVSPLP